MPTHERLLRALFDKLPAMIAYWDADGRNVTANEAYVEWFGYHPEDMVGVHISEVLGSEVYAKNLVYIEGALAGEEQLFERTLVDQAGRTRHTQASYVPDVIDGQVRGFFVLVTDVTPRVEAQRAMDHAQSIAHLGSWSLVPATGEITWSRELFRIVGLDPVEGEPTLATLSAYIHPDDRNRVLSNIERAVSTGQAYESEYRIVRSDGEVRELASRGSPVIGENGEVLRVNGTLQDVTESNAVARDLATMNTELRQANQLNADVIAMLGHDIRTPLAVIKGYTELLDEGLVDVPRDQREMIGKARGAAERLITMLERILSLAAIDSGTIKPAPVTVDLRVALPEILASTAAGSDVVLDLAPDALLVHVDPVHFEQIIENLVGNAVRYGAPPVRFGSRLCGDLVVLAVSDGGAGVPAEHQSQLFSRFARTGTEQERRGGTGFGLYMSARLAEANGASLRYRPGDDKEPHAFLLTMAAAPKRV